MPNQFHTVEAVAGKLHLHAKTVRRYIQEGRLKARRIGKEYRIANADLMAFAGGDIPAEEVVPRTRQVLASTILDIDVISPEESHRITTYVMASLNARRGEPDHPRVDSIYYQERGQLRITITASPSLTCDLLHMINSLLEAGRG